MLHYNYILKLVEDVLCASGPKQIISGVLSLQYQKAVKMWTWSPWIPWQFVQNPNILTSIIYDQEEQQQMLTSEKPEPASNWHYCLKNVKNNESLIRIIVDSFPVHWLDWSTNSLAPVQINQISTLMFSFLCGGGYKILTFEFWIHFRKDCGR